MTAATVHDLVRLDPEIAGRLTETVAWVAPSLRRAPWAVVRRDRAVDDTVPIGIRGTTRAERFGTIVCRADVRESLVPADLWGRPVRNARLARAFEALAAFGVERGLAIVPVGSFAFELASGARTTHDDSDLDVLVDATNASREVLVLLCARIEALRIADGVRVDVELAYEHGAAALSEIVARHERVLFKTSSGPRLLPCPV